ncbi:hypothetical protein PENSPDRAFT_693790 [Peniophora sp. CONT]|nr:hypothetical protein PENSPDRAFT_693790 [Peniophora sp. CONT]
MLFNIQLPWLSSLLCDLTAQQLLVALPCLPCLVWLNLSIKALTLYFLRWAQAAAVSSNSLYIYGGHTDQYNQFTYDNAPWNNDLLYLNLGASWDPNSAPWSVIGGSNNASSPAYGPGLAWGTLSAFADSQFLLFGGQAGPLSDIVLQDNNDSAVLINVWNRYQPSLTNETSSWAGEPQRRMRHSAATVGGKVYIVGGERADGSTNGFGDHYVFDPAGPSFSLLPTDGAPPDIYGHATLLLPDGRIIVLGGWHQSQGSFVSFSQVWLFDPSSNSWSMANVDSSNLPDGRLGFCATALPDGRIIIQGGGNSGSGFGETFSDGWILDTNQSPMKWEEVQPLSLLGARRDHFCVTIGSDVLIGFGYSSNGPADANMHVYDPNGSSFVSTYTPQTTPSTQTTVPPTVPTTGSGSGGGSGVGNTSGAAGATGSGSGPGASRTSGGVSPTSTGGSGGGGNGNGNGNGGGGNGGGNGDGNGGGGDGNGNGNGGGGNGSGSGDGGDGVAGDAARKRTTAIVIGVVLGVLALVAGAAAAYWYHRRRRMAAETAFTPLDGEDGDHAIPVVGANEYSEKGGRILSAVPLFGFTPHRQQRVTRGPRRDMLADEDRSFNSGSGGWSFTNWRRGGSGSAHSRLSRDASDASSWSWSNTATSRTSSVRSALAALGLGAAARAGSNRRSQRSHSEKHNHDPYSDEAALMAEGLAEEDIQRPRGGAPGPSGYMYSDPFADSDAAERGELDVLHDAGLDSDAEDFNDVRVMRNAPHPALRTALPPTADFVPMSPLIEQASRHSFSSSSQAHSSQQHTTSSGSQGLALNPYDSISSGSHSNSAGPHSPRPSSILDHSSSPAGAMSSVRRSDTWWRRLAESSLLPKRRQSDASARTSASGFVDDFRDPNPLPRTALHPIKEGSQQPSPDSPRSSRHRGSSGEERVKGILGKIGHGKSVSSIQTANSETIERVGAMNIVQRDGTYDSNWTTSPTETDEFGFGHAAGASSSSQRRPLVVRSHPSEVSQISQTATESSEAMFDGTRDGTPTRTDTPLGTTVAGHTPEVSTISSGGLHINIPQAVLTAPSGPRSPGLPHSPTLVPRRLHEYERRLSQAAPVVSSAARPNLPHRGSSSPRARVQYGLAPRASLYVANPDDAA